MPRFKALIPCVTYKQKALIFFCWSLSLFVSVGGWSEAQAQTPAAGDVVFSQIYSRGGNPGSTYKDNFVELFNRSNTAVEITGLPFHFATDTGSFNFGVAFTSSRGLSIPPGGYLLIEFETTGTSGGPLPIPDLFVPHFLPFSITLSPSGKIALTMPGASLSPCVLPRTGVIDFVGYGSTANCFEGTGPTATLTETTAAIRRAGGCTDTNNNASDFVISAPTPRNSFSPRHLCSANQIDDADFFVRQQYSDFLNRQPDAAGLAFWTNQIASCGASQTCINIKRVNVSAAFFLSIEFQETGYLVYRAYKAAYGNLPGVPVPLKFDEFLPDTQLISQGVVVNAPGWEQQLANNKAAFFLDFVSRSRFRNTYLTSMSPAQFADGLFAMAGVTPSTSERAAVINEFGGYLETTDVL